MGREGESGVKGIGSVNMRGVIVGDQTERERETKKAEGQQGGAWEHPPRISGQVAPRISLQRETVLIAVCVHVQSLISTRVRDPNTIVWQAVPGRSRHRCHSSCSLVALNKLAFWGFLFFVSPCPTHPRIS